MPPTQAIWPLPTLGHRVSRAFSSGARGVYNVILRLVCQTGDEIYCSYVRTDRPLAVRRRELQSHMALCRSLRAQRTLHQHCLWALATNVRAELECLEVSAAERGQYGFTCCCSRCILEKAFLPDSTTKDFMDKIKKLTKVAWGLIASPVLVMLGND